MTRVDVLVELINKKLIDELFSNRQQTRLGFTAATCVLYWIHMNPQISPEKRENAFHCAEEMLAWGKKSVE
jgi:hypothetical protein